MKIAIIIRKLNLKGGTQRQALSLARELKNKGHEVVLHGIYYSKEGCYPELLEGFRVVSLPSTIMSRGTLDKIKGFAPIQETVRDNREAAALAKLMDGDFDLLNPHDQVSYKVAHYYKKTKRNIPAVWNMNDLPQKVYGFDRASGCDDNFKQAWWRHLAYRIFDWYENNFFLSSMDEIVVVDFFNRDLVLKYLGREAFTVRSGPDFEHFSYKERSHPKGEINLLSSGILMPHRRYEDSIKALLLLQTKAIPAKLTIMGDIENDKKYHAKLLRLVEELGLQDSVTFTGRVSETDLVKNYHDADVYLFQHHLQSDGLSPFEAAATGLPLIVSRTAGCHEILTHMENAILVKAKSPTEIADAVEKLYRDESFYKKMSISANKFLRENLSWEKYASGVMAVMQRAIERTQKLGPLMSYPEN